jgi:hypothetical protein
VLDLQSAPFALDRGPLLRAVLLRLAPGDHVLCLTMHHILFDGWSLGVFLRDVTLLYRSFASAAPPPPAVLPVQYADFAAWQRQWLQGDLLEEQLADWQRRLGADPAPALLPADHPPSRAGGPLEILPRTLPAEVLDPLLRLGREQGATLFMILVAAVQLLIYRYTGSRRTVVGSMHANRTHAAVEDLIGFFVNVLPLPATLAPDWTFRDLLREVRATALEAYAHQATPYEKILSRVCPDAAAGRNPLFQVMVVLQNMPLPPLELEGLGVSPFELDRSTRRASLDLTLSFVVEAPGLRVWAEYDSGLFERATAERLLTHLEGVLRDAGRDPGQRLADLPSREGAEDAAGRLWLTDPAGGEEPRPEALPRRGLAEVEEKSAAIQSHLAARRSQLSEKQQALLRRLTKRS